MNAIRRLVTVSVLVLLVSSACTDQNSDASPEGSPPPYFDDLFEDTFICEALTKAIPAGYLLEEAETPPGGSSRNCIISQQRDHEVRRLVVNIAGDFHEGWESLTADRFAQRTEESSIPVDGLGDEAAVVPISDQGDGTVRLALQVREGNVLLESMGHSYVELEGPRYWTVPLTTTTEAIVESAEFYLTEIGAENADAPDAMTSVSGPFNELPDLCSELVFDGLSLAADQAEWADDSDVMDRCHWSDGEADLWLSAEAVGPPPVADVSAEEFATWWAGGLPVAGGEELGLGDQSAIAEVSLDDGEAAATDFVVRIGNVVLQGRYSDGTGESRSAAEGFAAVMTEQVQALLAGS